VIDAHGELCWACNRQVGRIRVDETAASAKENISRAAREASQRPAEITKSRCSSATQVKSRAGRSTAGLALRVTASAIRGSSFVAPKCHRAIFDHLPETSSTGSRGSGNLTSGIEDITEEEWELTFKVNIHAMFHLTKAAVPDMKPGGAIINTASINSDMPNPTISVLCQMSAWTHCHGCVVGAVTGTAVIYRRRFARMLPSRR
jgi:NAD(P)-dependent dehydrogenase (short-subunit alcohol dehydrogenase family)